DGLDEPDGRHLGEVVEPLAAVAEAARQVFDQRQVQLHQLVPDALATGIVGRELRQLREQRTGTHAVGDRFLADGHGTGPFRHVGLAMLRRFRSTIAIRSGEPVTASTAPAKAVSTIQAKSWRLGVVLPTVLTSPRTSIS